MLCFFSLCASYSYLLPLKENHHMVSTHTIGNTPFLCSCWKHHPVVSHVQTQIWYKLTNDSVFWRCAWSSERVCLSWFQVRGTTPWKSEERMILTPTPKIKLSMAVSTCSSNPDCQLLFQAIALGISGSLSKCLIWPIPLMYKMQPIKDRPSYHIIRVWWILARLKYVIPLERHLTHSMYLENYIF